MIGIVFCARSKTKAFLLDSVRTTRPLRSHERWKERFSMGRNARVGDLICASPVPALEEDLGVLRDEAAGRIRPYLEVPLWSRVDLFCVPYLSRGEWDRLFTGKVRVGLQAWVGNELSGEIELFPRFSVDYICNMTALPREVLFTRPVALSRALCRRAGLSEAVLAESDSFFTDVVAA